MNEMNKLINCKNCDEKYSNELPCCPFCGTRTPLSFLKKCVIMLATFTLIIASVGIVFRFTEKDCQEGKKQPSSSDVNQNLISTESKDSDGFSESNSALENSENEITESKIETPNNQPSNNSATTTSKDESAQNDASTTSKPQEQKPTNQIPQNEISGVQTADITLPIFFDATEGLKTCRDLYRPLSFIILTSGMDGMASDFSEQFNGDYILEIGGNIDKVMIYTYRIRYDFADVSGAKAKFEKHLDDHTEFFNAQLALYKEYSPDVTGIQVIFEHDDSNQTLTLRTFK